MRLSLLTRDAATAILALLLVIAWAATIRLIVSAPKYSVGDLPRRTGIVGLVGILERAGCPAVQLNCTSGAVCVIALPPVSRQPSTLI